MKKKSKTSDLQHEPVSAKILVGLERISEAFKVLIWNYAKELGLSPIQIQILVFVDHHHSSLCNVSSLAREFNLTKPTVSDAIKALDKKGMIVKKHSASDSRSYTIALSPAGKKIVSQTEGFATPIKGEIDKLKQPDLENLFSSITQVIHQLNQTGILQVQRMCLGCRFHSKSVSGHYCQLLEQPLYDNELRLDCPEFESKNN